MNDTHGTELVTTDTRNPGIVDLRARVRQAWETLSRAERSVSAMLTSSTAERLLYAGAADLGTESGTSNATVVRTLQKLGYTGLSELKRHVASPFSDAVAPEERLRRRLEFLGEDADRIVTGVLDEAAGQIELARTALSVPDVVSAAELLTGARRIYCYGVGASTIAAEHLTVRLGRVGRPATHIDVDGFRIADELLQLAASDVVVLFAPGRVSPEVETIVSRAHDVEARVILVTDELRERLAARVAVTLTAPHTPTGLTAEVLSPILVGDVLAQLVAAVDPELAVETSHSLTVLRARLGY